MIMLTRSLERISYPMRYTAYIYMIMLARSSKMIFNFICRMLGPIGTHHSNEGIPDSLLTVYNQVECTREIPAFGGISLALRGSGAFGATFGRLRCPRWGACGAYLGNRRLWRR